MNNYEFCARWVRDQNAGKSVRVLDYGCGTGQIVKELRKDGVEAYGCDVFYDGGDSSRLIEAELLDDRVIRRMDGDVIPFDSASFDFVVNNQVMEHVENLDRVLAEIDRVMKPDGFVLSLFPHKGVWREGHCGVPFLHWFPKGSSPRIYYAAGFRALGFGHHKGTRSVMRWSRDFCEWIDQWTYYRSQQEIEQTYGKYFADIRHIEDRWLDLRLKGPKRLALWLPATVQKLVVKKLGSMVFASRKPV